MKRLYNITRLAFVLVLISEPAMAYVDPGSGSMIIQLIIAASVGAVFYFRQVRDKIKSILFGDEKINKKTDVTADTDSKSSSGG